MKFNPLVPTKIPRRLACFIPARREKTASYFNLLFFFARQNPFYSGKRVSNS